MDLKLGSFLTCLGCAGFWISAAFIVGFPQHVFSWNWSELSNDFIFGVDNETILIPFLLLVDVVIAGFLNHLWVARNQILIIAAAAAIYILVTGIAPKYAEVGAGGEPLGNHFGLFFVALMCLCSVRFVTLLPKRFVKLQPFPVPSVAVDGSDEAQNK
jgi:uncharacterized membrane protein